MKMKLGAALQLYGSPVPRTEAVLAALAAHLNVDGCVVAVAAQSGEKGRGGAGSMIMTTGSTHTPYCDTPQPVLPAAGPPHLLLWRAGRHLGSAHDPLPAGKRRDPSIYGHVHAPSPPRPN